MARHNSLPELQRRLIGARRQTPEPGSPIPYESSTREATVVGTVVDSATATPLAYANVVILGTGLRAVTQADGSFAIDAVPAGACTVLASYIGYASAAKAVALSFRPPSSAAVQARQASFETHVIEVTPSPSDIAEDRAKALRDARAGFANCPPRT
jgi:hypothetical protein